MVAAAVTAAVAPVAPGACAAPGEVQRAVRNFELYFAMPPGQANDFLVRFPIQLFLLFTYFGGPRLFEQTV